MNAVLTGKSTNVKRSDASNIIGDANYFKEKNGKHIYKDKYTDTFYLVYVDSALLDTFIIEQWKGQCSC